MLPASNKTFYNVTLFMQYIYYEIRHSLRSTIIHKNEVRYRAKQKFLQDAAKIILTIIFRVGIFKFRS